MRRILLMIIIAGVFAACSNGSESDADSDTNVNSITPPPRPDTNPIGVMMGDTTNLKKDSLKK